MQWYFKYFISAFIVIICCLQNYCLAQTTTVRPYKFGFTIDEQQHRYEKRDERGIVMGEFGFITADGIYHVTVYATDEQGRFRILAMKNYPYESPPKTVEVVVKPKVSVTTTTQKPVLTRHNFNTEACSGCFLKNGNNKPKDINAVGDKNVKTEIRPLSKVIPSSPKFANKQPGSEQIPSVGTQPRIYSETPTTGNKIKGSKADALLAPKFKEIRTLSKTLPVSSTSEPTSFTQVPSEAIRFSSKPSKTATFLTPKSESDYVSVLPPKVGNIPISPKVQQHVIEYTPTLLTEHILQQFPTTSKNEIDDTKNTFASTTKSVIQNFQNPLKTKTNNILHNPHIQTDFKHENILNSEVTEHEPALFTHKPAEAKGHLSQPHISQQFPTTSTNQVEDSKNFFASTTRSVIENLQNPLKAKTNHILHNPHTQTENKYGNNLNSADTEHASALLAHKQQEATIFQRPSHHSEQVPTTSRNEINDPKNIFESTTKSLIENLQNPLKTKTNHILHNPNTLTENKYGNTLNSAATEHAPTLLTHKQPEATVLRSQPHLSEQVPTDTKNMFESTTKSVIENIQNPLKTKTNHIVHNPHTLTENKYGNTLNYAATVPKPTTPIKNIIGNSNTPITTTPYSTAIPTTTNKQTGSGGITHTQTPPTFSKVTNPTTNRPGGSPGLTSSSNTQTGNPAIMDIIVDKILPTLMGNMGKSPTPTTTTGNSQPKATPSSNIPGTSKTFIPASNPGSSFVSTNNNKGNSNPSSANGDGDLYRFKYILDTHGHTETGKRNGNKEGNYFAIGDDDIERTVEYVANENGYQPHIRWRKLNQNEVKSKENTLKEYEFIWFTQ